MLSMSQMAVSASPEGRSRVRGVLETPALHLWSPAVVRPVSRRIENVSRM